jgi:hypothetical protein
MTEETWQLSLPITLPLPALFHLLQLGQWRPDEPLRCTPLSIATAGQRGFSLTRIEMTFMDATGQSLSDGQMQQLLDWYERGQNYRIDAVYLLSARQPHQLAQIVADGRLRRRVHRQISPRHALVSPAIRPSLQRWLARRNSILASSSGESPAKSRPLPDAAYSWLGLRLLVELAGTIELPFPAPYHSLAQVESRLTPHELTELEQQVLSITDGLRAAIRGRDAFFPAHAEPPHELIEQIQQAMAAEQWLDIAYQSLLDRRPYRRRVYPLRLEARGRLHYLHAYCSLAEADRIFRLDRIADYSIAPAISE